MTATQSPGQRRLRLLALLLFLAVGVPVAGLAALSYFSPPPAQLGVVNGRLTDCPDAPNCVGSQASDPGHQVEPLHFEGNPTAALARLQTIVAGMPGARLITVEGGYLHAEFTSRLFRFVDDVEFLIEPATQTIHCRSASRVGHSDLGVNRQRLAAIRLQFDTAR